MTQGQLAEAIGVTRSAVCMWEGRGEYKNSPSQGHLAAAVEALGLTMERFYGRIPKERRAA